MASNYEVKAELECCVCQDSYSDPVILPCGHSFCRQCLLGVFKSSKKWEQVHGCQVSYIDCPVCRHPFYTTQEGIEAMSVNLILRNIVSAMNETNDEKLTTCPTHNRPHYIFCYDCETEKCLTCFVEKCGKSSHNTKEIDEMGDEIREELRSKYSGAEEMLTKLARSALGEDSILSQLQAVTGDDLMDLIMKAERVQLQTLEKDVKEVEKVREELKESINSSNASLVSSRQQMAALTLPDLTNSDLSVLNNTCKNMVDTFKTAVAQLTDILRSHGIDPEEKEGAVGGVSTPSLNDADLAGINMGLQRLLSDNRSISAESEEDSRVPRFEYQDTYIYSVSAIGGFFVNTDRGCSNVDSNSAWFFDESAVKDMCTIPVGGKVLAIRDNQLQVHRYSDMDVYRNSRPVYVLPAPSMPKTCRFECIGVTRGDKIYYVASDANNACIHVWHAEQPRGWCEPIDVSHFVTEGNNRFKLCVFLETIYISFHHQGMVYALDLNGIDGLWTNVDSCEKPNGIAADASGIYVCDGGSNHCIQILNHDGTYRQTILGNVLQHPMSVAVEDSRLAVLETYNRQWEQSFPSTVYLFDLTLLG